MFSWIWVLWHHIWKDKCCNETSYGLLLLLLLGCFHKLGRIKAYCKGINLQRLQSSALKCRYHFIWLIQSLVLWNLFVWCRKQTTKQKHAQPQPTLRFCFVVYLCQEIWRQLQNNTRIAYGNSIKFYRLVEFTLDVYDTLKDLLQRCKSIGCFEVVIEVVSTTSSMAIGRINWANLEYFLVSLWHLPKAAVL